MEVTVEDVMHLPSTQNCRIVAGKMGLCKTVRWFLGLLSPTLEPWVHEHEVVFVYGNGLDTSDSALLFLLEQCANKSVSALFFIIGPVFESVPQSLIERADVLDIPLIEMPNEIPVVDITKEIAELIMNRHQIQNEKGVILKNLIFGHESDYEKYGRQLEKMTTELMLHEYMNVICIHLNEQLTTDNPSVFANINQMVLSSFGKNISFWSNNTEVVILVNNVNRNLMEIEAMCKCFLGQISQKSLNSILGIGIGNTVPDIVDVAESYRNALKTFYNMKQEQRIISYESMSNIGKLLEEIQSDQVLRFCFQNSIGKLLEYDEQHEADLLNTLRVYLEEEGNITRSSQKLFIHRNTMVYRINKIKGILNMEIEKIDTMIELKIALNCYERYIVNHN